MKPKPPVDKLASLDAVGSVMPLRIAARRLGWDRRSIVNAKKNGLRSVRVGRFDITTAGWIEDFIIKMAAGGSGNHDGAVQ